MEGNKSLYKYALFAQGKRIKQKKVLVVVLLIFAQKLPEKEDQKTDIEAVPM